MPEPLHTLVWKGRQRLERSHGRMVESAHDAAGIRMSQPDFAGMGETGARPLPRAAIEKLARDHGLDKGIDGDVFSILVRKVQLAESEEQMGKVLAEFDRLRRK